jgi:histone H3/H4
MSKGELSGAAIHRLIEKAGASRVGDDAIEELSLVLEEVAVKISREALDLASHAGRKTVKSEDIRLSVKRLLKD